MKNAPIIFTQQQVELTQELVDEVQAVIEDMGNGLTYKGALSKANISPFNFHRVVNENPELKQLFTLAKHSYAQCIASEVVDIADDRGLDYIRAKNMIDARKWSSAKLDPANFGDRMEIDIKRTVSLSEAIEEAKMRTVSSPHQDHKTIKATKTADIIEYNDLFATDSESDAGDDDPY